MFEYRHPHDIVNVVDGSVTPVLSSVGAGPILLTAVVSDRGDEGLTLWDDLGAFLNEYGKPNIRKHGQSIYNAINRLQNGGRVLAKRIVSPTSKYANTLVSAHVKTSEVQKTNSSGESLYLTPGGQVTTTSIGNTPIMHDIATVKIVTSTASNLTDKKMALAALETGIGTVADGYTIYPLFAIMAGGRGTYGNNIQFRVTVDNSNSASKLFKNYKVEVITSFDGKTAVEGPFGFAFKPGEMKNGNSLALDMVLNKFSTHVSSVVSENGVEGLYTFLADVAASNEVLVENIDFLVKGNTANYVVFESSSVDVATATGVKLQSGSNGDWTTFDFDTIQSLEDAFVDFYAGTTDSSILDPGKTRAHDVLDANYPLAVKTAMYSLAAKRQDLVVTIDGGVQENVTMAETWRAGTVYDNYQVNIHPWSAMTLDLFTGREIQVTSTYFLAGKRAAHNNSVGYDKPMAGITYGALNGIIPGTVRPQVNTPAEQDGLYGVQLNYVLENNGAYYLACDITSQGINSELSIGNNVWILADIIRKVLTVTPVMRFSFTDADSVERYVRYINTSLEDVRGYVQLLEFTVAQTAYERANRILSTYIIVQFKGIVEKFKIQIDVQLPTE